MANHTPSSDEKSSNETSEIGGIENNVIASTPEYPPRTWRFWIVFPTLCISGFLVALDGTITVTALPTISQALGTSQYTWIINSYTLSSTVFQALFGQLAEVLDRKPVILGSVVLFSIGSAVAGAANSLAVLLVGRTIQGIGGGAIPLMAELITSDMVPLIERPKFFGAIMATTSLGLVLGPIVGGAILDGASWRWIFLINLPLVGVAILFLLPALPASKLIPSPTTSSRWGLLIRLKEVDWMGNGLFAGSALAVLLPLTMGGSMYPWSSFHIILPLVLGVAGFIALTLRERFTLVRNPFLPGRLFRSRQSIMLQIQNFIQSASLMWVNYFLTIYFQTVRQHSPERAGFDLLPTIIATMPFAVIGGVLMSWLRRPGLVHLVAFAIMSIGLGTFTLLQKTTSEAALVIVQIAVASGNGLLLSTLLPALQSQVPSSDVWCVTALFSFIRSFALVWGVTIPSIIFDEVINQHVDMVPDPALYPLLLDGGAYAHATSSFIGSIPVSLQGPVIDLYVVGLRATWWAAMALGLFGLLSAGLEGWGKSVAIGVNEQQDEAL